MALTKTSIAGTTTDTPGELPCVEVLPDLPFHEYKELDRVNQSSLKSILKSPAHYQLAKAPRGADEETPAMRLGSLTHLAALEPSVALLDFYVVQPEFEKQIVKPDGTPYANPKNTKAYRDLAAQFAEANADKDIVTRDQLEAVRAILSNIKQNELAQRLLGSGDAELVVLFELEGIPCKTRLDLWNANENCVVDLKTTRDAVNFNRSILTYGYDFQAAFYLEAAKAAGLADSETRFAIVAAETTAPFGVRAGYVGAETIRTGYKKLRRAVDRYKKCTAERQWPCYDNPPNDEWNLPAYAIAAEQEPITITTNGKEIEL